MISSASSERSELGGTATFTSQDFDNFFERYLPFAPLPLALERAIECEIYASLSFERPILDIGCGDGIFAKVLFAERIETGIDPDPRELTRAAETDAYQELIECSGDAIPKPTGSYRTIFANSVLEHIPALPPVLAEMNRLLDPEGRAFVTVPTHRFEHYTWGNLILRALGCRRLASAWQRRFKQFWSLYHTHPAEKWQQSFEEAGFVVASSFEYEPPRLTLLKEVLMPFSIPGAVSKRLANRWVLVPWRIRRIVIMPGIWLVRGFMRRGSRERESCLLFMELRKASA